MTDAEAVVFVAKKVMEWTKWADPARTYEGWVVGMDGNQLRVRRADSFDPVNSHAHAFEMEEAIAKAPQHIRQKYINAMYNLIAGRQEFIGSSRIYWGMLHATPRQRTYAIVEVLENL